MMTNQELSTVAAALATQVFTQASDLLIGKGEETPENTEATVQLILLTAAHLEAFVVNSLPPEKAQSVRAFLDRFLAEVQRKINQQSAGEKEPLNGR